MSSINASGTLYIRQNGSNIQYSPDNSNWTTISSWPVTVNNTTPAIGTILNVLFTTDITTTNTMFRFIAGTSYITFDGLNNTLTLNNVTININIFNSNSKHTIKIKDFIATGTGLITAFCENFGSNINSIPGFNPNINFCSIENCNIYNVGPLGNQGSGIMANNGYAIIRNCNLYNILKDADGGSICGSDFASNNGVGIIENCYYQLSAISRSGIYSICGSNAGNSGGSVTISNCAVVYSPGTSGRPSIVNNRFGSNTNNVCSVSNCYTIGINQIRAGEGAICGSNAGFTNNASYNPIVNITNCYMLSLSNGQAIDITGGGIIGRADTPSTNIPTVNVSNCYSYANYRSGFNNGIAAPGGLYSYNVTNCYAVNTGLTNWSDASANSLLTGFPTSFYSNNPGTTWAKVVNNTTTPYVLSAFNSAIYYPSMVEQSSENYTSAQGLFQSDYSYNLLSVNNSAPSNVTINGNNGALTFSNTPFGRANIQTAEVFVSQGTPPYYKNYNLNTFAYSNICFPAKTPIQTDQGLINIEDLNPEIHTIRNKKIVGITQTITNDKYLVCFEKDCLGKNVPCQKTFISQNHAIFNKGKMIKAKKFVGSVDNVYMKKYKGEVLYNVLMEEHDKMLVNNLICETLHPENSVAKLYLFLKGMSPEMQQKHIKEYNEEAIEKKIYTSKK